MPTKHLLFYFTVSQVLAGACWARFPSVIDVGSSPADVTIYGAADHDKSGWRLLTGDINGDEELDLIILSDCASPLGRIYVGQVDIVWGPLPTDTLIDLLNPPSRVSHIFGSAGDEGALSNIACGDMNKDGYDEVIFGVPCESSFIACDGKAYVIFGTPTFPDTVDLDDPSIPVTCIHGVLWENGFLGDTITTGDINNDTFEDLIISAPNTYPGGIVYAILGRDSFPSSIDLATYNQDVIRIIDPDIYQGTAIGLVCEDVDKDNFDDVFLGSPGIHDTVCAGKGTVLFGAVDLPDTVFLSDESIRMIRIFPVYSNGQLGRRVAIGDVDGDQEWDLIKKFYFSLDRFLNAICSTPPIVLIKPLHTNTIPRIQALFYILFFCLLPVISPPYKQSA